MAESAACGFERLRADGLAFAELDAKLRRFWIQLDRLLPDAFVHANVGPGDSRVVRSIWRVERSLRQFGQVACEAMRIARFVGGGVSAAHDALGALEPGVGDEVVHRLLLRRRASPQSST